MNATLRAKIKAWDRNERNKATTAMAKATEAGNLAKTRELLSRFPLLDHWIPYEADGWSQLAAAAGQLELMKFWRKREMKTRPATRRASLESLLFWAMGYPYIKATKGNPVRVAEYLLGRGADIEGEEKGYSPLHRAVYMNRPKLVALLIRRGADLARPYVTGDSALQIAHGNLTDKTCVRLLEQAGAPLELPKKAERPKPVRTVDLREAARKLEAGIEKAFSSFVRQHEKETVTAIACASIPHEGYVMVSFHTGEFTGSPWDCTYSEFAWAKFPEWIKAHEGDMMRLIDQGGKAKEAEPDSFLPQFMKMIVAALQSHEKKGTFDRINTAEGCRIGIEMTSSGDAKFWRLRRHKVKSHGASH